MKHQRSLLILGGSSPYMLLLFRALSRADLWPKLNRVTLFGRQRRRLAFLSNAAAALAGDCEVDYSDDYAACVARGYDLVFNQIRFGGLHSRDIDERIAIDCGLVADETLGIVGISNAMRTLHGLATFVEPWLVHERRPRWINFTNPCSIVTQYLVEQFGASAIGICDYPVVFQNKIAACLGAAPSRVQIGYFGLNHMAFVHDIRLDGEAVLEQFLAHAAQFDLAIAAQSQHNCLMVPSWDMVYDRQRLHARQRAQRNRASVLLDIESASQRLIDTNVTEPAAYLQLLARRDCAWYEIAVAPLLALCLGHGPGEAIINLAVPDVFDLGLARCVVETNAVVDADSAQATVPPQALRALALFEHCRTAKQSETRLLAGVLHQDRTAIFEACRMHPMIGAPQAVAHYFARLAAVDAQIAGLLAGRPAATAAAFPDCRP